MGAFEALAAAHVLQGNWVETERVLSKRFRLPISPFNLKKSWHMPDLIATIFRASTDRRVWMHRVGRMTDLARDVQEEWKRKKVDEQAKPTSSPTDSAEALALPSPLSTIAESLVRSLTKPSYAEATGDALEAWADVWRNAAERHPALALAVRLFGVGVRYLRTKDERVLLDLVREERAILRDLFKLDDGKDEL